MLRIDYSGDAPTYYKDGHRISRATASDELARLGFPTELTHPNS